MAIFYTDSASFSNVEVTNTILVSGSMIFSSSAQFAGTGSLYGTASWAQSSSVATTASYALNATATVPVGTVSSSAQVNTGSFTGSFIGLHTSSLSSGVGFLGTSSWAQSSSIAVTASYALAAIATVPAGTVSSSAQVNTGSFTGSFTGSLLGTSSWAQSASIAVTASYALAAIAVVPAGTVSSSTQFKTATDPFTGSFSGSHVGTFYGGEVTASNLSTVGALQFLPTVGTSVSGALYYGNTSNIFQLRNYAYNTAGGATYTLLNLWPWQPTWGSGNYESTIALTRADNTETNSEFMDVYNNGYTSETQFGIRLQKRGAGIYRNFVIDYSDGVTKLPVLVITGSSQNIGIANSIIVNGSASFIGSVTGSTFTGSFTGDGSQLTGISSTPSAGTVSSSTQVVNNLVNQKIWVNNIGIGNTTAASASVGGGLLPLMVDGGASAAYVRFMGASDGDNYAALELWSSESTPRKWQFAHKSIAPQTYGFMFNHNNGVSWSSPFYIASAGSVGIGTVTPGALLHVQGNVSASTFTSSLASGVGFLGTASYVYGTVSGSLTNINEITGKIGRAHV